MDDRQTELSTQSEACTRNRLSAKIDKKALQFLRKISKRNKTGMFLKYKKKISRCILLNICIICVISKFELKKKSVELN